MNQKKFKVLLLADAASFHTERFYAELQKQNCEVLLASLENGISGSVTLEKKGFVKQLYYRRTVGQIKKLIIDFQPDIISAHFASGYGHIAALAKQKANTPLALNLWGSDILIVPKKSIFHKYKTRYALKKAQYVFADSQYLIDAARELYQFNSYTVIPWGIEKDFLGLYKQEITLSSPLKIIVPRAHETVYNNLFIVQSLKERINAGEIILTFPAFGSLCEEFKTKCTLLVGDKIKFYEKAERKDFLKLASEQDVYLSASLSDSSPVSLIEAMAIGLVPVVMNIDGVKEWVSNENGFMFEHETVSLSSTIEKLLNTKTDINSMRANNKKRVQECAVFEKNIEHQISIFKSLVKESN